MPTKLTVTRPADFAIFNKDAIYQGIHSRGTWLDEAVASFSVEDLRERKIGWMGREPSAIQISLPWCTHATERQNIDPRGDLGVAGVASGCAMVAK